MQGEGDVNVLFIHIVALFDLQYTFGGKHDAEDNVAVTPDMIFIYRYMYVITLETDKWGSTNKSILSSLV